MTNLQRIRKECGMSQSQLAKASGVKLQTLQGYEVGTRSINGASVTTVLSLAKALDVDVESLIEKNPVHYK